MEGSFTKPIAMTIPIYAISSSSQTLTHFMLDGCLFFISTAYRFVSSTQVCISARGINKFSISVIVVACKACLDGPGVSTYGTEDPVLPSIPVNFFHDSSPLFFFIGAPVFGFFVFLLLISLDLFFFFYS